MGALFLRPVCSTRVQVVEQFPLPRPLFTHRQPDFHRLVHRPRLGRPYHRSMSTPYEFRPSVQAVARDDEVARLRVPPHSTEAEQSVLGGLLLDNLAWDKCSDLLSDSDFYRHEHRHIYAAVGSLIASSKPADVITVFEALESLGKAEDCGGLAYLNALAQSVPSASNVRRYAEIVRERSVLRKLISASDEIATTAFNPQGQPVSQILDEAESRIFRIGEEGSRGGAGFQPMDKLVQALIDRVQELEANGSEDVTGIRTGFYDLDRMTAGLQKGDLIVLAARPSMGKTAFALNIAEHVAVQEGLPVAVFSMEMGASQLALRVVGSLGRIDQQHLRTGRLRDDEWERLPEAASKLSEAPMFIDESPGLNPAELRARARRLARQYGGTLGLIVIDYLQLMSGSSNSSDENRATVLGEISRGMKGLAKELQCPVLALSQLNRSVETRPDKRPMMSDLRESGAIEQDADVIMFIYRDDYYNKDSKEPGVAEIVLAKQRNGPVGTVKLTFLKPLTRFDNLALDAV
jgi:replicative DNA helicase